MNEHGAEAVRKELIERGNPNRDLTKFLEAQIWPLIPAKFLGREIQKEEIEEYLRFGPGGV